MITFRQKGDFSRTYKILKQAKELEFMKNLERYGQEGVTALSQATPKDSGETARSWYYEITRTGHSVTLSFHNSHINKGVNVAILLQYGHGTGWGGYVQGRDYINPAIQPIFDRISEEASKEVAKL